MFASTTLSTNTTTHASFAKKPTLAKPVTTKRAPVCKASKGPNETLKKLAGAAAAVQIALLPFAGTSAALDLPDPLSAAQDAKSEVNNAAPKNNTAGKSSADVLKDLPGPAPSLSDTKQAFDEVASGGGGLKEAARGKGANISSTRATGDIGDVGDIVEKGKQAIQQAIPSNGNAAAEKVKGQVQQAIPGDGNDPIGDRQAVVDDIDSTGGPDGAGRGGSSGHPRAANVGTVAVDLGDLLGKAKEAAPDAEDIASKAQEVAPDAGDIAGKAQAVAPDAGDIAGKAQDAKSGALNKAKDVSVPSPNVGGILSKAAEFAANSNGGLDLPGPPIGGGKTDFPSLNAAVASKGANISRVGDAMPNGLKPGQYSPS